MKSANIILSVDADGKKFECNIHIEEGASPDSIVLRLKEIFLELEKFCCQ